MNVIIEINLHTQQLGLFESNSKGHVLVRGYPVSTALNGAGKRKRAIARHAGGIVLNKK